MSSAPTGKGPVIAIVGPTASGKSELGVELALREGGEVINCDSVQVYRGIEIATAKPSLAERCGVPHHLLDFVPPDTTYTAADWARDAIEKIGEIEARGKMAVIVGGTGFYLRALTEGLFEGPPTDPSLRHRLKERAERWGPERLHRLLRRLDPVTAARLAPRDASRVIRALEVRLTTGEPLSRIHAERPRHSPAPGIAPRVRIIALAPPRDELYRRIDARTDAMFAAGLVDEVRDLLASGVPANAKALGAHGYRRVVEYLLGERTLESAIEQTKLDTRHYAKRQLTWWRGTPGVHWIHAFGQSPEALEEALAVLAG